MKANSMTIVLPGDSFAEKLHAAMLNAGMSQVKLAGKVWGRTVDGRGKKRSVGRDRLADYLSGIREPGDDTVTKIAKKLKVDPAILKTKRSKVLWSITSVDGSLWRVRIARELPATVASELANLIEGTGGRLET